MRILCLGAIPVRPPIQGPFRRANFGEAGVYSASPTRLEPGRLVGDLALQMELSPKANRNPNLWASTPTKLGSGTQDALSSVTNEFVIESGAPVLVLARDIDKSGSGWVKIVAENDAEDMWNLYNLISVGNYIRSSTIRKVQRQSSTGSSEAERLKVTLTVEVSSVEEFDGEAGQLRLSGRNVGENEHVKVGAYHTIEIEPNRAFVLQKLHWDFIDLERLNRAVDPSAGAEIAVVVMQEGMAHVCLVSRSISVTRARVETNIPRKGINAVMNRDKAMEKFFEMVYRAISEKLDLEELKVIVLASPGFVKDNFYKYLMDEAAVRDDKPILRAQKRFILARVSSGQTSAVQEVLSNQSIATHLADVRAMDEARALNAFHDMLNSQPDRAFYGLTHVQHAANMSAVQTLLVTDALFRNVKGETRKKYVALVEQVQATGGEVHVLSTLHQTGQQLSDMTGVAAILRFPLPDLEDIDFDANMSADEDEKPT